MSVLEPILINTYNPNYELRQQAEQSLLVYLQTPGSVLDMLSVVGVASHRDIRLAAAIVMKNRIRDYWLLRDGLSIDDSIKPQFKSMIVQFLVVETDNSIKKIIAECIRTVCEYEFPERWPELIPSLLEQIKSGSPLPMFNALLAIRHIAKRYEYKPRTDRAILDAIIDALFPILQELLPQLIDNNALEAAHVMRMACKIFWSCTQQTLPVTTTVNVGLWFQLLSRILMKNLPEASEGTEPTGQPTDPADRRQWPWWKLKKWAVRILLLFIQRYGNPRHTSQEYQSFAKFFRENLAVTLLEPIMNILAVRSSGAYVTDDVFRMALSYVSAAVEMSPAYKALKPHLDFLLFQAIFPTLCLTPDELQLFEDDPQEFVRKVHDPVEDFFDPRLSACELLRSLARYRQKEILPRFLPFIQGVLSEYTSSPPDRRNYKKKEGVLVAFGCVVKILRESKEYSRLLLPFLTMHVIPEFESPAAFIRARAFWLIDYYNCDDYSDPPVLEGIVRGVLKGLSDKSLPVQAAAACTMSEILEAEGSTEMLRPMLGQLIHEYFRIMEDLENDAVLSALQALVTKFGSDIKDMAPLMAGRLAQTFYKFLGSEGDEEMDDEAALNASECLTTILAIMDAVKEDTDCLLAIEPYVIPMIISLLASEHHCLEFLEQLCAAISYVTYYPSNISAAAWTLCGPLLTTLQDSAIDYIGDTMTPLLNYMTKDVLTFLQGSANGVPLVQILLNVVQKIFIHDTTQRELDAKLSCTLVVALVVCSKHCALPQVLDSLIAPILSMTFTRLTAAKALAAKLKLIDIVLACIYYNPHMTLAAMDALNPQCTPLFFDLLFENIEHIDKDASERILVLAFQSLLFQVPPNALPTAIQKNAVAMFKQIIREIELIEAEAAKEEKSGGDDDDEEDEDDDEDSDIGEDDIDDDDDDDDDDKVTGKDSIKSKLYVPDGGYGEDEDCVNAEDESYREYLEKLNARTKGQGAAVGSGAAAGGGDTTRKIYAHGEALFDEDDEDDEYDIVFPTDNIDILSLFVNTLQDFGAREPQLMQQLSSVLEVEDSQRLTGYFSTAAERAAMPK